MGERNHRMVAKDIIDEDRFLDMPVSARLLYYDLIMRADDDGFVGKPKSIMRMTGASIDDMNVLISRSYVINFDSGVIVIRHWRIHNYIRKDRYHETDYIEEKNQLEQDERGVYEVGNQLATSCNQCGNHCGDQLATPSISKEKYKVSKDNKRNTKEKEERLDRVLDDYNAVCEDLPKVRSLGKSRKQKAMKRLDEFTDEEFHTCFVKAQGSDFLSGRSGGWNASWDWFMTNDNNIRKVLEGNYDNRQKHNNMGGLLDAYDGKYKWRDGSDE